MVVTGLRKKVCLIYLFTFNNMVFQNAEKAGSLLCLTLLFMLRMFTSCRVLLV